MIETTTLIFSLDSFKKMIQYYCPIVSFWIFSFERKTSSLSLEEKMKSINTMAVKGTIYRKSAQDTYIYIHFVLILI